MNLKVDKLLGTIREADALPEDLLPAGGTVGQVVKRTEGGSEWANESSGASSNYLVVWFEAVASGTAGTLSAPAGGTLVADQWPDGTDALATELDAAGRPTWKTPRESGGSLVTATLDVATGAWTLSGTPASYPVGIVFAYTIAVADYDPDYALIGPDYIGDEPQTEISTPADTDKFQVWQGGIVKYVLRSTLNALFEAAGAVASHVSAYAHGDIASNSGHRTTTSGNPHGVTIGDVGGIPAPGSPTQGNVIYYNGSAWVVLAPGTSGQFLQTLGAGANPAWATASGGSGTNYPLYQMRFDAVDAVYSSGAATDTSANCCWRKTPSANSDPAYVSADGTLYLYSNGSGTYYVSAVQGTPGTDYFSYSALTGNYAGAGAWSGETLTVATIVPITLTWGSVAEPLRSLGATGAVAFRMATNLVVPTGAAYLKFKVAADSYISTGVGRIKARLVVCDSFSWASGETDMDITFSSTLDPQVATGSITLSGVASAGNVLNLEGYRFHDQESADTLGYGFAVLGGEVWFE